jgi:hypothetical protein
MPKCQLALFCAAVASSLRIHSRLDRGLPVCDSTLKYPRKLQQKADGISMPQKPVEIVLADNAWELSMRGRGRTIQPS